MVWQMLNMNANDMRDWDSDRQIALQYITIITPTVFFMYSVVHIHLQDSLMHLVLIINY